MDTNTKILKPCKTCERFPVPTSRFKERAISVPRHATLYQCNECGLMIEIVEGERSHRYITNKQAQEIYGITNG